MVSKNKSNETQTQATSTRASTNNAASTKSTAKGSIHSKAKLSTNWKDYLRPGEDEENGKDKKKAKDRLRKATSKEAQQVKKGFRLLCHVYLQPFASAVGIGIDCGHRLCRCCRVIASAVGIGCDVEI